MLFSPFSNIDTKYVDSTHYGQMLILQVREGVIENKMSHLLAMLDPPSAVLSPHSRHYPLPSLAALYQYSSILICCIPTFSSRANLLAMVLSSSNGNLLELLSQSASTGFTYSNHWPCGYAPFPHGICCPSSPARFEIGGRSFGLRPRIR
jgi:hypothetical protein